MSASADARRTISPATPTRQSHSIERRFAAGACRIGRGDDAASHHDLAERADDDDGEMQNPADPRETLRAPGIRQVRHGACRRTSKPFTISHTANQTYAGASGIAISGTMP